MDYIKIHENGIVVDAHSDIPLDLLYTRKNGEHSSNLTNKHLPILQAGGINVVFMEIYAKLHPEGSLKQAMLEVGDLYEEIKENEKLKLIRTKNDFKKIATDGTLNIVLSMEGLEPLGSDLTLLNVFYELGIRSASLTWNNRNYFASGVSEIGGLSNLGKKAIKMMEELGIIVDVSHLNEEGFWDIINIATKPIIASHSNAKSLYNCDRNLSDEQIRAIVKTGGVIGIVCYFTEEEEKMSLESYMKHLEYMIKIAGEDHVGLGLDFNGYLGDIYVPGIEDASKIPSITNELCKRGYSESTIYKILGGNFLRVLNSVLK
ncbi:dipeptidase [Clostridium sp.]|uniref:dipeptidase n=1 Tax=Clostridium sp. TaxID=1506 RepID=UPI003D6CC57D